MKSSDIEQRERQKFIGSTTTQTYHSRSLADLALELAQGGRHAKPASVIGSEPTIRYPRQPEGSPWAFDPVPNEEPFGVDINSQEVTGTPVEVEQSLASSAPLLVSCEDDAQSAAMVGNGDGARPAHVASSIGDVGGALSETVAAHSSREPQRGAPVQSLARVDDGEASTARAGPVGAHRRPQDHERTPRRRRSRDRGHCLDRGVASRVVEVLGTASPRSRSQRMVCGAVCQ
jgi:hypothetical protein